MHVEDIELLNGMFDHWLNPNAMKPMHDFLHSHHKIPSAFFKVNPRPKDLIQGFLIETSMIHLRSPEICCLSNRFKFITPDRIINDTKLLYDTLKIYRIEEQPLPRIPSNKEIVAQVTERFRNLRRRSSIAEPSRRSVPHARITTDRTSYPQSTSTVSLLGVAQAMAHPNTCSQGLSCS